MPGNIPRNKYYKRRRARVQDAPKLPGQSSQMTGSSGKPAKAKTGPSKTLAVASTAPSAQEQQIAQGSSSSNVQIPNVKTYPKTLYRPPYTEISIKKFCRLYPAFDTSMHMMYIRDGFWPEVSAGFLEGITGTYIEVPPGPYAPGQFPGELQIFFHATASRLGVCPTHVIAVPPTPGRSEYILFSIHSLPIGLHCTNPPDFPLSEAIENATGDTAVLPVVFYQLPSPSTFHAMRTYLYNKDEDELLDFLAPRGTPALWATSFKNAEVQCAKIYGMSANAYFMGIIDQKFYTVLQTAWDRVYSARRKFLREMQ